MSSHELSESIEIAKKAIAKMEELEIPAIPLNFMVWYHYFANSYLDLRRTVDVLLDNDQEFSAQQCADLYERFFVTPEDATLVEHTGTKLEQVMTRAAQYLGEAGSDAAVFGEAMAEASGDLSRNSPEGKSEQNELDEVRDIIKGVVEASRQMEVRSKSLEERLAAASTEVSELKMEIEAAQWEAQTDSLTGIANRKKFDIVLRDEAAQAMESGEPLCLLMIDIDFFKKFNDTHGHQTGDRVLKLLALTLKESIKGQDTAARYGGEEFTVILPRISLADAAKLADQIRERVGRKKIINKTSGETLGEIHLSVGVALYELGESLTNFISRADEALYAAKHRGRNRVITENEINQEKAAVGE